MVDNPIPRTDDAKTFEAAAISGPTLFVNRYNLQNYPDGNLRLVFMEQYTAHTDVPLLYRTGVYLTRDMAITLAQDILRITGAQP